MATIEAAARCGTYAVGFKLSCDLPKGHVKSPADWHKGAAKTKQVTSDYEWSTTEVVRWAPMSWEIPKVAAGHEGEVR